jgi:hypothetical protein
MRLNVIFRGIARCQIGNGQTVCFWDDLWTNDVLLHQYPRLASYARSERSSVFEIMQAEDLDSIFMMPLSVEALEELEALQQQLQVLDYDEDAIDKWTPIWGGRYTSNKFYKYAFSGVEAHAAFKVI